MKIDWKKLAQSPGYKSLKAAYIRDVHEAGQSKRPMRKKAEFLKLFRRVIGMAQHYAVRTGKPVEQVINEWEEKRDYWWLNFYSEHHLSKLASGKPRNVQHQKTETYLRSSLSKRDPESYIQRLKSERTRLAKVQRKIDGKKARWSTGQKAREARIHEYRKEEHNRV